MNRKVLTIILIVALVALLIVASVWYNNLKDEYANVPAGPESGENSSAEAAPDFTVYDGEGNAVNLSDKFGKPIAINFWATWCGPCKIELPAFDNLYAKYGDQVEFMMVNMTNGRETEEGVKDFVASNGYSFPVYYDLDMSAAITYNLRTIPRSVFINSDGTISATHMGVVSEDALEAYIEAIIEN